MQGNHLADEAAKAAASKEIGEAPSLTMALTPPVEASPPKYTEKENDWAVAEGATLIKKGWWMLPNRRIFVQTATEGI